VTFYIFLDHKNAKKQLCSSTVFERQQKKINAKYIPMIVASNKLWRVLQ